MSYLTKIISADVTYDIKDAEAVNKIVLTNVSIGTSAWSALSADDGSGCYAQGYTYRAAVPNSGILSDHYPQVTFAAAQAINGGFAPIAMTYAGGVYVYASSAPSSTITIPTIVCLK